MQEPLVSGEGFYEEGDQHLLDTHLVSVFKQFKGVRIWIGSGGAPVVDDHKIPPLLTVGASNRALPAPDKMAVPGFGYRPL